MGGLRGGSTSFAGCRLMVNAVFIFHVYFSKMLRLDWVRWSLTWVKEGGGRLLTRWDEYFSLHGIESEEGCWCG